MTRPSSAATSGAVVEALASPDAATGTVCFVTDVGVAYPVPDPKPLTVLGNDAEELRDLALRAEPARWLEPRRRAALV